MKLWFAFAAVAMALSQALAAPVATGPNADLDDDAPAAQAGEKPGDKAAPGSVSSGSKTVDLLIELQGKNAGLDFSAAARPVAAGAAPGGAVDPASPRNPTVDDRAPATNRAGLFGAGAVPNLPTAQRRTEPAPTAGQPNPAGAAAEPAAGDAAAAAMMSRGAGAGSISINGGGGNGGDDAGAGGGRVSVPRAIVLWVRENRAMVAIGAFVLLLLVWATSMALSQRRH